VNYDQMFGSLDFQSAPRGAGGTASKKLRTAKPATGPTKQQILSQPGTPPDKVPPPPPPPPPPGSLGIPDLPPDIEANVSAILAADPVNGPDRALAYIRGTDWYKATYAGIGAGIKTGVIGNEGDYRAYVSNVTDTFQRYYGRPPTQAEVASLLSSGRSTGQVEQIGQGHAWAQANQGEVNYELGAFDYGPLSQGDLETLGQQQSGLGSTAGASLQQRLQNASARMQRLFEGVLASPSFSVGSGGLSAPSLQTKPKPDVGA
jgi:hypothetical protein